MTDTELLAAEIERVRSDNAMLLANLNQHKLEIDWLKAAIGTLLFERSLKIGQVIDLENGYRH